MYLLGIVSKRTNAGRLSTRGQSPRDCPEVDNSHHIYIRPAPLDGCKDVGHTLYARRLRSTLKYMRCRDSRSSTRTHSLTLWIVELTTPNSTTCAPVTAMKRPSEVPPVVESLGGRPVISATARLSASDKGPGGV